MVNRQRFLLDDLDSEGFPVPKPRDPLPLLALNLGRTADHGIVQALLADHKCLQCEPEHKIIPPQDYTHIEQRLTDAATFAAQYEGCTAVDGHVVVGSWVEEARQIVRDADTLMLSNHDGITRLSDSYAPDAYFGHKR